MNYLDIAKQTRQECAAAGSGPAAVTNQSGESKRIVDWVAQAHTEVQNRHPNWRWMRSEWSVNTVLDDDTYAGTDCTDTLTVAAITRFGRWWEYDELGYSNVLIYLQSAGVGTQTRMIFMPWANFRDLYRRGTQNNGYPAHFTVDPQNRLVIGPKPNGVYVMSGEYQRAAQALAADADIPEMPTRFHMLVVYEAMKKYAGYESAPEVWTRGNLEAGKLTRQLELDQLPAMPIAEPLA